MCSYEFEVGLPITGEPGLHEQLTIMLQGLRTVLEQLKIDGFPTSFAILACGSVLIPNSLRSILRYTPPSTSTKSLHWQPTRWHLLRFACTFVAGLLSFSLLNQQRDGEEDKLSSEAALQDERDRSKGVISSTGLPSDQDIRASRSVALAGRTIDLTFFGIVRATDVCLRSLWSYYIPRGKTSTQTLTAARRIDRVTGPVTFIMSSWIIM